MKLYDEEELRIKNERSKRMKNIFLVSIIVTILLIVLLMGVIYYLIQNPNNVTIIYRKEENAEIEEMILMKTDDNGETVIYFPIRKMAELFKLSSGDGDYGKNVENTENCFVESENEIIIFTENSNIIYKRDKTGQLNDYNSDNQYEEIKIDNFVIKEDNKLYIDTEGLGKAFNLSISVNSKRKKINITPLDDLIDLAEKIVEKNEYGELDDKYANEKALLDNMMVIKSGSNGKKGVRNFSNNEEILSFQYEDITYISAKGVFIVKKDEKVGIIDSNGIVKIKPQYDNLILIDSENELYLAEDTTYFGVIDENQNLKIPYEYKKIGVDVSEFKENDIKNGYVLLGCLIPAQISNGKWIFYKINSTTNSDGTKNVECKIIQDSGLEGIGCIASNINSLGIVNNLMVLKEYNLVVVKNYGVYGFMDINGRDVLGRMYSSAFLETSSGITEYCVKNRAGNTLKIKELLEEQGYVKPE